MERDPGVPVVAVGVGEPLALLFPGGANAGGVGARRSLERVERELGSGLDLPAKFTHRERCSGVRIDLRELAEPDLVVGRHVHGDRLREAHVAGFGREPKARAPVVDGQVALGDQRREERLAGIGRILAREPEGLRVRERRVAVALATVLHAIACELDVLARGRRVKGREARPLAALPQCLQPVHAQPVRERRFRPASEVVAYLGVGDALEIELLLPELDVRSEDVVRELRGQRVQADPVAAFERRARSEKIRVTLPASGDRE